MLQSIKWAAAMAAVVATTSRQENLFAHGTLIDETQCVIDAASYKRMPPRLMVWLARRDTFRTDGCTVMSLETPAFGRF